MSDRERELGAANEPNTVSHDASAEAGMTEEDRLLLQKYERMFTGTFAHTLDGKGRMVIPLAFRDMLGKTFTIAPEFDFKSIAIYPELAYVRMRERHAQAALTSGRPEVQKYLQWLDAYTFRGQEFDGQGRVLLPVRLRQVILGEEKDVDIMGNGDHLRIAARVKCDEQLMEFIGSIDSILSGMAL